MLRISIAACAGVLALAIAPADLFLPTLGAAVALNAWSVGYLVLMSRDAGNRLLAADAVVVGALCLTQRWTVPPEALHGSTSWVVAVVSVAVATWQLHSGIRAGGVAAAAVALGYLAGAATAPTSVFVVLWLVGEAVLARGLYQLVRKGAREGDRIMADAEEARRAAAVAAARRADEREHLAAMHDTAAATMLAIGTGVVDGREPWLATQLADALDEATRTTPTTSGRTDLVPLIGDVLDRGAVAADLSAPGALPIPATAAVAICRSVREALSNVARHAGVDTASVLVEHRSGRVVVEVADNGTGFDPELVSPHHRGISLSIMERMAAAGGRAEVTSRSGVGTLVRLAWPDG
ncbi:sensor histidine kinase [Actinophytocola sediminis]